MAIVNRYLGAIALVVAALLASTPVVAAAEAGQPGPAQQSQPTQPAKSNQPSFAFDLPAQPLGRSLLAVGSEAAVTVTFDSDVIQGHRAPALKGRYTVWQALHHLVAKTGLVVRTNQRGAFIIDRGNEAAPDPLAPTTQYESTYNFDLPSQSLAKTLDNIEKLTGTRIVLERDARDAMSRNVPAIRGTMTPLQAVERALRSTALQVTASPAGVLAIKKSDYVKTLGTVTVTGTITGLTATRTATPLREIPQTVAILSQQRIRDQNLFTLTDALNQMTGVTVVRNDTLNSGFSIRGFGLGQYHVDGGGPINLTFDNHALPDLSEYSHIEALRGADALFGGAGEPGGTINLVRKQPEGTPALRIDQAIGSWNNYRTQLDATGPIGFNGKLRARVVAMYQHKNFFYHTATMRRKKIYGIVTYQITPSTLLSVGGSETQRHDIPATSGLPRYSNGADLHAPRSTFVGEPWQREHAHMSEAFAKLSHAFNKRWNLNLQVTRLHEFSNELRTSFFGPVELGTGNYLPNKISVSRFILSNTSTTANAELSGYFNVKGWHQDIMIGADYSRNPNLGLAGGFHPFTVPPMSVFHIQYFPEPTNPSSIFVALPETLKQHGIYAAFRIRPFVKGLSVVSGARVNDYRNEGGTFFEDVNGNVLLSLGSQIIRVHNKVTPFAGFTYDLSKHYSIYASYAAIFRAGRPGKQKADGSFLALPIVGANLEAGIKGAWRGGLLNGVVAFYKIRQRGVPLRIGRDPTNRQCCYVASANRSHGVDIELNGPITPNWTVGVGYTFNINHRASLPGGIAPPLDSQTPHHLLKFWTNYRLPGNDRRLSIGGSLHALTSAHWATTACEGQIDTRGHCLGTTINYNVTQGAYFIVGLRVGYRISPGWEVALNLNNVLDRVYYQTVFSPTGGNFYGEPRNVMVTLHGVL